MQDVEAICICPLVLSLFPAEGNLIVTQLLPGHSASVNVGQRNAAILISSGLEYRRFKWMIYTLL